MSSQIRSWLLASVLALAPLHASVAVAETTAQDVKKETRAFLQTLAVYTEERKDEAAKQAAAGLRQLDERLDALEASVDRNWDRMNATARQEARENLAELRRQRNQLSQWYGSMKASSGEAWDHMKQGFSDAYKELHQSWEASVNALEN